MELLTNLDMKDVLLWVTTIVTAASMISALTKTKKDDKIVGVLKKVVDVLALNVLNAKKVPEEEPVKESKITEPVKD